MIIRGGDKWTVQEIYKMNKIGVLIINFKLITKNHYRQIKKHGAFRCIEHKLYSNDVDLRGLMQVTM